MNKTPNHLLRSTSPCLLQHAYNPVDWYPWGDEALNKAKRENKLLLISIGYSACHWCHVMERECFEDHQVAQVMNENYVCIKVDREERPDIDQVYMSAVQLMTGRGGWPLNCIALPDGRPLFGGTYFPKHQWIETLKQVSGLYKNNLQKALDYAEQLTNGIKGLELARVNKEAPAFTIDDVIAIVHPWKKYFDNEEGGPNRYPKFPLPNNYEFLLRYYHLTGDRSALDHTLLTLNKMAFGGIYDQAGGGFSRYSTDELWKVPHFEKMLYDNAQLVSLYSMAFRLKKDPLYKQVVYETLAFVERELTSSEGAFYSALDADSEGEEGKYYVWKKEELEMLFAEKKKVLFDYFNINEHGLWEDGNYILLRRKNDEEIIKEFNLTAGELADIISDGKNKLLEVRQKRVRPGLDDKQLTSWNALMIKGYAEAYRSFGEEKFLDAALKNGGLILTKAKKSDGGLFHNYKNNRATINGYLEDYSFTIEAFIALYECTFDMKWIREASVLMQYTIDHFFDPASGMFYFTSDEDPPLITRNMEVNDNVIPASNSSMAKGLFLLGKLSGKHEYINMSAKCLNNVKQDMARYGSSWSNWGILLINFAGPFYELVVAGKDAEKTRKELNSLFFPNRILAGFSTPSGSPLLPLLENKYVEGKTIFYLCENSVCQLPVENIADLIQIIEEKNLSGA